MADRRRRVPLTPTDGNNDRSGKSECESEQSEGNGPDADNVSEYASADEEKKNNEDESDSDEEESDDDEEEETDEEEGEGEYDEGRDIDIVIEDEEWVDEERQSGDGEEQPDSKDVDDDEDRKNPAFVPRKGAFYEHDMRLDSRDTKEIKEEDPDRTKKRLWKDNGKWLHDGYNESKQGPKSTEELVCTYGYDVRAGNKPPDYKPVSRRGRGRRVDQNLQFQDFIQSDFKPRKSEENEYVPIEYRSSTYKTNNYKDAKTTHAGRGYRSRHQSDEERRPVAEKTDHYISDSRPHGQENYNKPRRDQVQDSRNVEDNYQDSRNFNDNYQDYRKRRDDVPNTGYRSDSHRSDYRAKNRSGYRDRRSHGDYNSKPSQDVRNSQSHQEQFSESLHSTRGDSRKSSENDTSFQKRIGGVQNIKEERGRGSQNHHNTVAENGGNFGPTQPRQFSNSAYRSPKTERFEAMDATDINISSKDNVQTISVTVTNTTTEKRIFSKDNSEDTNSSKRSPPSSTSLPITIESTTPGNSTQTSKFGKTSIPSTVGETKPDISTARPKRYSSQRQRGVPDTCYKQLETSSGFFNQGYPSPSTFYANEATPPQSQDSPTFPPPPPPPAMLQPALPYPLPVSSTAPRLFAPNPQQRPTVSMAPNVSLAGPHPPIIPPNYMAQGTVIYGAAPPVINSPPVFPVPLAYAGSNPPQQIQSPPSQPPKVYHGGTIFYPPELQSSNPQRSPVRRTKSAIPIVNPQAIKGDMHQGEQFESQYDDAEEDLVHDDMYGAVIKSSPITQVNENIEDVELMRKELKEISLDLITLDGELRTECSDSRATEEDCKNFDLQQKLDSYLHSDTADEQFHITSEELTSINIKQEIQQTLPDNISDKTNIDVLEFSEVSSQSDTVGVDVKPADLITQTDIQDI